MHVLFVEPKFPANQRQFVRALHAVGAKVTGIGEYPPDPELSSWMHGFERVRSVVDEAAMEAAVRGIQARGWVDRLEATVEAHILPVATVRERCRIPGTSVRTAFLCRDKPAMKEALRAAGVPCAQSIGTNSAAEVRDFARRVGFPLIVKPRSAAGASGTVRVDDAAALEAEIVAHRVDRGAEVAIEEFIEGHEGFYDSLTIDGRVVHDFVSHYYPGVLEAMRTRWISPQIVTTNRLSAPTYDEVRAMGKKVIEALGIGTSATHQEWFFGPKGLKFSEIGCRPPGVGMWDVYSAANDFDLFREWASAIVNGRPSQPPSRKWSAGMIALRPSQDGRIAGYDGVEAMERRYGDFLIDSFFPPPGHPTQPVEAGYMANAWVRMKHPDYDTLRGMLNWVGENVKVRAVAG
jgi:formate-dependent phosphoribosylglycinamide formyltransferase (GAR transformylase)